MEFLISYGSLLIVVLLAAAIVTALAFLGSIARRLRRIEERLNESILQNK